MPARQNSSDPQWQEVQAQTDSLLPSAAHNADRPPCAHHAWQRAQAPLMQGAQPTPAAAAASASEQQQRQRKKHKAEAGPQDADPQWQDADQLTTPPQLQAPGAADPQHKGAALPASHAHDNADPLAAQTQLLADEPPGLQGKAATTAQQDLHQQEQPAQGAQPNPGFSLQPPAVFIKQEPVEFVHQVWISQRPGPHPAGPAGLFMDRWGWPSQGMLRSPPPAAAPSGPAAVPTTAPHSTPAAAQRQDSILAAAAGAPSPLSPESFTGLLGMVSELEQSLAGLQQQWGCQAGQDGAAAGSGAGPSQTAQLQPAAPCPGAVSAPPPAGPLQLGAQRVAGSSLQHTAPHTQHPDSLLGGPTHAAETKQEEQQQRHHQQQEQSALQGGRPARAAAQPPPASAAAAAGSGRAGAAASAGRTTFGQLQQQLERQGSAHSPTLLAGLKLLREIAQRQGAGADVEAVEVAPVLLQMSQLDALTSCMAAFEAHPASRGQMLLMLAGVQQLLEQEPVLQQEIGQQHHQLLSCVTTLVDTCRSRMPALPAPPQHVHGSGRSPAEQHIKASTGCRSAGAAAECQGPRLHAVGGPQPPAAAEAAPQPAGAAAAGASLKPAGMPTGSSMLGQLQQPAQEAAAGKLQPGVLLHDVPAKHSKQPACPSEAGADSTSGLCANTAAGKLSSSTGGEAPGKAASAPEAATWQGDHLDAETAVAPAKALLAVGNAAAAPTPQPQLRGLQQPPAQPGMQLPHLSAEVQPTVTASSTAPAAPAGHPAQAKRAAHAVACASEHTGGGVMSSSCEGAGGAVDLYAAEGELFALCAAEDLLSREQLVALQLGLGQLQEAGGAAGAVQLARFSVDFKWVLLCRGLTVAHRRAAMCYLLSNTTRSASHPAAAELVGWSSSWLKAEGSLVGVVGGLLGSAPMQAVQEGLEAVLSALPRLVQRSCNDHQTKGFLSKLRWVQFCKDSPAMTQDDLQNAFDVLATHCSGVAGSQ